MTTDPSTPSAALDALADQLRPGAGLRLRQAALAGPLRGFHQRLLRAFVAGVRPPDAAVVGRLAGEPELDPQAALAALAAIDLVHVDPATGAIRVAYPFSGQPTPFRVELAGGPGVFAMCAIDALGIPQMLGRDARINANDPASGQPITVGVHHGVWRFVPETTVVLEGRIAAGDAGGAVADCCCPHINFHIDRAVADAYHRAHPGMTARLLDQAQAVTAAGRAFGSLLNPSSPPEEAP